MEELLVIFSSLITFDDQKFGKVNFNEAIQAIYNLTLVLPETKLDDVQF